MKFVPFLRYIKVRNKEGVELDLKSTPIQNKYFELMEKSSRTYEQVLFIYRNKILL